MSLDTRAREQVDALLTLAETCTEGAQAAAENAADLDKDASLSVKNWTAAALSATQAWMTATRQDGRR